MISQDFIPIFSEPLNMRWNIDSSNDPQANNRLSCQTVTQKHTIEYDPEFQAKILQEPFYQYMRLGSWCLCNSFVGDQTPNIITKSQYYIALDDSFLTKPQYGFVCATPSTTSLSAFVTFDSLKSYRCMQEMDVFEAGNIDASGFGLDIPTELQLDEETAKMCMKNALITYIKRLDAEIYKTYENVSMIKHRVLDYGDPIDGERLRFEIHLTGEPEEILKSEKKLHAFLFKSIPEEKQHFFSFTYRIT